MQTLTSYGPFPEHIISEIRKYHGNLKCCDCPSLDNSWANINHGTLVCLDCAGKHRSLGVQVSFIRSIYMDTWNENQVRYMILCVFLCLSLCQIAMMKYGGNGRIREYFKAKKIEKYPINVLYMKDSVELYRCRLKEHVEFIMSKSSNNIENIDTEIETELIASSCKTTSDSPISPIESKSNCIYHEYVFDEGPMGFTLTKNHNSLAIVSKLIPSGVADRKGILIGDSIIGIMGKSMIDYDDIMRNIVRLERPIKIRFSRIIKSNSIHIQTGDVIHHEFDNYENNRDINYEHEYEHEHEMTPSTNSTPKHLSSSLQSPSNSYLRTKSKSNEDLIVIEKIRHAHAFKTSILSSNNDNLDPSDSFHIEDLMHIITADSNEENKDTIIDHRLSSSDSNDRTLDWKNFRAGINLNIQTNSSNSSNSTTPTTDYRVIFESSPLGLTLTKCHNSSAEVTSIIYNSSAYKLGIIIGDILVGIENNWIQGYDDAISILKSSNYPITLVFRRGLISKLSTKSPKDTKKGFDDNSIGKHRNINNNNKLIKREDSIQSCKSSINSNNVKLSRYDIFPPLTFSKNHLSIYPKSDEYDIDFNEVSQ